MWPEMPGIDIWAESADDIPVPTDELRFEYENIGTIPEIETKLVEVACDTSRFFL